MTKDESERPDGLGVLFGTDNDCTEGNLQRREPVEAGAAFLPSGSFAATYGSANVATPVLTLPAAWECHGEHGQPGFFADVGY